MTEKLLTQEVNLAAPLALRERRKRKGWSDAVYYLQLKGGRMMVLRPVDDGQALGVFHFDKDTCQANTPSISQFIMALTKGKTLSLMGVEPWPARTNYPEIEAVFACSRELQTAAEVKQLTASKEPDKPILTMYDELTEFDIHEAPDGTHFYATRNGQVFECSLDESAGYTRFKLAELRVGKPPARVMYLDQTSGPSKVRMSRRQNEGATWRGSIGPFDHVFSSVGPMDPNAIREHLKLPGRHQSRHR